MEIMMKKNLIYSALLIVALASQAVSSPPLEERYTTFKQADGSEVTLTRYGDARFHWLETRSGKVVVKNSDTGDYEYAKVKKENDRPMLVPSGVKPGEDREKNAAKNETVAEDFTPLTRKDLIPLRKAAIKHYKKTKPVDNKR